MCVYVCEAVLSAQEEELAIGSCGMRVCPAQLSAGSCLHHMKMLSDINTLGVNRISL